MKYIFLIIFFFSIYILYEGLQKDPNFVPSNLISKEIPEFSIKSLEGKKFTNLDLENKEVVVLNFFASWCPPCRIEHPQLLKLSNNTPVFGIAKKNKKKDLLPWLDELGSPYEIIGMDYNGLQSINWGVYGLPETFIIKQGLIKYRHVGPIMKRDLEIFKNLTNK